MRHSHTGNRLLDSLAAGDLQLLLPHLKEASFSQKQTLNTPGETIEHVYFPTARIISLTVSTDEGASVEVGIVGVEGLVGIPVLLGSEIASNEAGGQIAGAALRIPTGVLLECVEQSRTLRLRLLRFAQAFMFHISQSTACNVRHTIDERCARWLLAAHDRVSGDDLLLTHEFLGMMLGVRRAGVTVTAGALQRAGLIRYRQGRITVLDREGLESAACDCYRAIKDESARLMI